MSIHPRHLRELIIRPALRPLGIWSANAEELLLLTSAQETYLGRYLRQVTMHGAPDGVGLGIYSMEADTFNWLRAKYTVYIRNNVTAADLISDLNLATVMARLRYLVIREPLPDHKDISGMAHYWHKYYNTRVDDAPDLWRTAVINYERFVLERF